MQDFVDIYVRSFPFVVDNQFIYPEERKQDISSTIESKREEKFYVWKLLEYAIKNSLDRDITEFKFFKDSNKKWHCDDFYFSLSHGEGVVVVAVSNHLVGVDIEKWKSNDRLLDKIACENEINLPFSGVELWTRKEAVFKKLTSPEYFLKSIDTTLHSLDTRMITINDVKFVLSTASDVLQNAQWIVL